MAVSLGFRWERWLARDSRRGLLDLNFLGERFAGRGGCVELERYLWARDRHGGFRRVLHTKTELIRRLRLRSCRRRPVREGRLQPLVLGSLVVLVGALSLQVLGRPGRIIAVPHLDIARALGSIGLAMGRGVGTRMRRPRFLCRARLISVGGALWIRTPLSALEASTVASTAGGELTPAETGGPAPGSATIWPRWVLGRGAVGGVRGRMHGVRVVMGLRAGGSSVGATMGIRALELTRYSN